MAQGVFTPYSTVAPFIGTPAAWVGTEDQERVSAYQVYEEIYWNAPETFKLTLRGEEQSPIYIPSGRIIVNTMDRYFGKGLSFKANGSGEADVEALNLAFKSLMRRERFMTKFSAAKRTGLIHGDFVVHILADPTKPAGSRLRLLFVDPAAYFPITDENDPDRIVKVHLAEQVKQDDGGVLVKRQTYERTDAGIVSSVGLYEIDNWRLGTTPKVRITEDVLLPQVITSIPVYAWQNNYENGNPFGSSEMRGLERLMVAINQSITDEDISLALEGLGVYKSGGGAPVNDEGEDTDWVIGPGRVVEDSTFERVNGVSSVGPYQEHLKSIFDFMMKASGTPDSAVGKVDVTVAESGVARLMEFAPILARAEEKNGSLKEVLDQMSYDLQTMWLPVYEQFTVPVESALMEVSFGDALPPNKKEDVDLAVKMVTSIPPIMSAATAREWLAQRGLTFAPDEFARLIQEKEAFAETSPDLGSPAAGDDYAQRVASELAGGPA